MQKIHTLLFILFFLVISTLGFAQGVIPNTSLVGINTDTPLATLHVQGDLQIRSVPFHSKGFQPLVISENGTIGTYNGVVNNLFYAQSVSRTVLSTTEITAINSTDGYVVPWITTDIKYNPNLLSLDANNSSFTMSVSGVFEVGGMISYNPQVSTTNNSTGVNVFIQRLPVGSSTWVNIAATRYFYLIPFTNVAGTINIAPAMQSLDVGDKLRVLLVRYGAEHGSAGSPVLEADDFTKMLKVTHLE